MRIAFLSSRDAAGQRFNGLGLHRALLAAGHASDFVVAARALAEPRVHDLGPRWLRRANQLAQRLEARLSRQSDLAIQGHAFARAPGVRDAELIHLQLLHEWSFFSLRHLARLADGRRPVVWTLHDPWIMTGHCVHPLDCERWRSGCGQCPDLGRSLAIRRDRTAANWAFKRAMLARSRLHLVVASDWMAQRVAQSPILAGLPCTCIPFGIDTTVFAPRPKAEVRARLGIPADARVVGVRWRSGYALKGTALAEAALLRLPAGRVTDVIAFDTAGGAETAVLRERYRVTTIDTFDDPVAIATGLAACDVFLMPSAAETFGLMAVEAMACGAPPVVFAGTALCELIDPPHGGLAVAPGDAAALAGALEHLMLDDAARAACREHGLAHVRARYAEARYVADHLALYRALLEDPAPAARAGS